MYVRKTSVFAFFVVSLLAAGIFAASAFNSATTNARAVTVTISADSAAYLKIAAGSYSSCFSSVTAGKIAFSFGSASGCDGGGTGSGMNVKGTYFFHDMFTLENRGASTLLKLWINTTSGGTSNHAFTVNASQAAAAAREGSTWSTSNSWKDGLAPGESTFRVSFKFNNTDAAAGTSNDEIWITGKKAP